MGARSLTAQRWSPILTDGEIRSTRALAASRLTPLPARHRFDCRVDSGFFFVGQLGHFIHRLKNDIP